MCILVKEIPWDKIKGIKQFLTELGENSMSIYAMQWYFFGMQLGDGIVSMASKTVTALIMPWAIGKYFISRIRILNIIMLGGR